VFFAFTSPLSLPSYLSWGFSLTCRNFLNSSFLPVLKACVEKKKLLAQHVPGTAIDISDISKKMADLNGEGKRHRSSLLADQSAMGIVQCNAMQ
jgi:hypothetical protein